MPFESQAQARGAFSGAFGPTMKAAAPEWAHATPGGIGSLPDHVKVGAAMQNLHRKAMSKRGASKHDAPSIRKNAAPKAAPPRMKKITDKDGDE